MIIEFRTIFPDFESARFFQIFLILCSMLLILFICTLYKGNYSGNIVFSRLSYPFFIYFIISVYWSEQPIDAFLQVTSFFLLFVTATSILRLITISDLIRANYVTFGVITFLGIMAALVAPELGQEHRHLIAGLWRGLSVQKNAFGAIAAFTAIISIAHLWSFRLRVSTRLNGLRLHFFVLAMALLALTNSGSRGALVLFAVGVVMLLYFNLPLNRKFGAIFIVLVFAGLLVTLPYFVSVEVNGLDIAGVDFSSSNRFNIWQYGFDEFARSPWFGKGFAGFWTEERTTEFLLRHGWVIPNFHNGYISILIEGGVIGFALLALIFLSGAVLPILRRYISRVEIGFPEVFCGLFLLLNTFEDMMGRSLNVMPFLFFAYATCISVQNGQSRYRVKLT